MMLTSDEKNQLLAELTKLVQVQISSEAEKVIIETVHKLGGFDRILSHNKEDGIRFHYCVDFTVAELQAMMGNR